MWETLKNRDNDFYFINFFNDVKESLTRTKLSYSTGTQINADAEEIVKLSENLSNLLKKSDFDTTIYHALSDATIKELAPTKTIYEYSLEDFEIYGTDSISATNIQVSDFLMQLAEMAQKKAKEHREIIVSNTKNSEQTYFIRYLTKCMRKRFNTPLRNVVAVSASIIFNNSIINIPYVAMYAP